MTGKDREAVARMLGLRQLYRAAADPKRTAAIHPPILHVDLLHANSIGAHYAWYP